MDLPTINAALNGLSLVLVCAAYLAIRLKRQTLHRNLMLTAIASSTAFLVGYLVYHFGYEAKSYTGSVPTFYYTVLITHVVLAAIVPVGVVFVVLKAFRGQFDRHKRLARWVFPVWGYVSLTGIFVYYMIHV